MTADRGTGHLFQPTFTNRQGKRQKSSIWWWRVSIDGKKQALCTHCTDARAARRWVRDKLAELGRGDPSVLTAERIHLDDLERLVRDDYTLRGKDNPRHVPLCFRRLRAVLGNARVKDLNEAALRRYAAARLEKGAAPATVNLDFALLGRGFTLAARCGQVPAKPWGWMPRLRVDNARKGFFERPAFEAVLAHLPANLRPLMVVAYVTGWRLASDLLTRQWRHVDLEAGVLRLEPGEGKSRHGRTFPFTPELRAALETQRAYTDSVERTGAIVPWVFHREGVPIRDFSKAWQKACAAAGQPGALRHDFRRTAARNLIRAGVSEGLAMQLIGLATPALFRRYCVTDEAMLREATDKLAVLHERQRTEAAKVTAMRSASGAAPNAHKRRGGASR